MEITTSNDKLYHFYRSATFSLAKSIILKNSLVADKINTELQLKYAATYDERFYVDESDPKSWRYYKHLHGEYHPADTMMEILSLDTQKAIKFTKENLDIHRATWREYQKMGDEYNRLVARFPDQELLIRGCLNPIDKDKAINAKEYDIIYYNGEYVQSNESFLISELQQKITDYLDRWDVSGYALIENLYEPTRLAILYMFIPSMLMNIRLKYANTVYAHDYHVWNKLGSIQGLDRYKQYLTREQKMWLYLTIDWIKNHPGQTETFDELLEYLMTKRKLPVSSFKVHRLYDNVLDYNYDIEIRRQQLNLPELDYDTVEDVTDLHGLMTKELDTALNNEEFLEIKHDKRLARLKEGSHDNIYTKVLESHVTDYTAQEVFPLDQTLWDYWIYMALEGRYETIITVINPKTGETITMTPKEALIVFMYSLYRSYGRDTETTFNVGKIIANDIYFPVIVNWESILSKLKKEEDLSLFVRYIKDNYPAMGRILSTEEFNKYCRQINQFKYQMRELWGHVQDLVLQGEVHMLTESIKADFNYQLLDNPRSFFTYFREKGWNITEMNRAHYETLATNIFEKITGSDLSTSDSIENIQSAMVRIFEKLSSYHIHFTKTINAQEVIVLDPPSWRFGWLRFHEDSRVWHFKDFPKMVGYHQRERSNWDIVDTIKILNDDTRITEREHETQKLDWELDISSHVHRSYYRHLPIDTRWVRDFWITSNKEEDEVGYFYSFRNGSLFVDRYNEEFDSNNTLSLKELASVTTLEIELYIERQDSPTWYDWNDFRRRHGETATPDFIADDGSLYLKDENILGISLDDNDWVEHQLDGFSWNATKETPNEYILSASYRLLSGFEWMNTTFKLDEMDQLLKDAVDENLPGFDWGDELRYNQTSFDLRYQTNKELDGFIWKK